MRVMMVHNRYRERGGEDSVFDAEARLVAERGHAVHVIEHGNREIEAWGPLEGFQRVVWNRAAARELLEAIASFRPDVLHVHNVFHALSPSVYHAARRAGVPVVQTLHNYRLFCLNGLFFRDGSICERCMRRPPWPGVRYRCYRGTVSGSLAVATMLLVHRALRTWRRGVTTYVTCSQHSLERLAACGMEKARLRVKPHFLADDPGEGEEVREPYLLYVGRYAEEKGLRTLISAMERMGHREVRLVLCGDGPLREAVVRGAGPRVTDAGWVSREGLWRHLRRCSLLVFPSELPETFGMSIIEAFATGTPVVAGRLGAQAELVEDGVQGLHFTPGDAKDLARKMDVLLGDPAKRRQMGSRARLAYVNRYSASRNAAQLESIYRDAIHLSGRTAGAGGGGPGDAAQA